jgi:hypothetical protein
VTSCKGAEVRKRLLGIGGRIVASVDRRRGRPFGSRMRVWRCCRWRPIGRQEQAREAIEGSPQ